MLSNDGRISFDHMVHSILGEGQDFLCRTIVQIVEEDASKTSALFSVFDFKVFIAPFLELGIVPGIVSIANSFVDTVEMFQVFCNHVGRSDIGTTSKPPLTRDAVPFFRLEISVVEVHCRSMRIVRMHDLHSFNH